MKSRVLILVYGIFSYLVFFGTILYLIGFVGGFIVPKNIDTGCLESPIHAIMVDLGLILLFAVQHTIMARPLFKEFISGIIPRAAERSTFVLATSSILILLFWQWRPLPFELWHLQAPISLVPFGISMLGWVIVFWSTFLIDHFDLFGLRQVWLYFSGIAYFSSPFVLRGLYMFVRHPLMLGFLIAFWFTPVMTVGHLLFALAMTGYIFMGIKHEERDLVTILGDAYERYRERTPMIFPGIFFPKP